MQRITIATFSFSLFLSFFIYFLANESLSQSLTTEDFLKKYIPAVQDGNTNLRRTLVKDNPSLARWIAIDLLNSYLDFDLRGQIKDSLLSYRVAGEIAKDYLFVLDDSFLSLQVNRYKAWSGEDKRKKLTADAMVNDSQDMYFQGSPHEAQRKLEKALSIYKSIDDIAGQGDALIKLGVITNEINSDTSGLEFYRQALSLYRRSKDRKGEADALGNIGIVYKKQGKFKQALEYYNQAITIHNNLGNKADAAIGFDNLGILNKAMSRYEDALNSFYVALELHQELGDNKGIIKTLNNIGFIHVTLKQYDNALNYFSKAMREIKLEKDIEMEVDTLTSIGITFMRKGDKERALEVHRQVLKLAQSEYYKKGIGRAYINIGAVLYNMGQVAEALESYKRGLAIAEEIKDLKGIREVCLSLGNDLAKDGHYEDAIPLLERVVLLLNKPEDRVDLSIALSSLGKSYRHIGKYELGLECFQRAYSIDVELDRKDYLAGDLIDIGRIQKDLFQYNEATHSYKQALRFAEEHVDVGLQAICYTAIGDVSIHQGEIQKAINCYDSALNLYTQVGDLHGIGVVNSQIGNAYWIIGDTELALKYLDAAYKCLMGSKNKAEIATTIAVMGDVFLAQGERDKAKKVFFEAAEMFNSLGYSSHLLITYVRILSIMIEEKKLEEAQQFIISLNDPFLKGKFYYSLGKFNKAKQAFDEAILKIDYQYLFGRAAVLTGRGLTEEKLNLTQEAYQDFKDTISITESVRETVSQPMEYFNIRFAGYGRLEPYEGIVRILTKMQNWDEAFLWSEHTKARTLVEAIANLARKYESPKIPDTLRRREQSLQKQLVRIDETKEGAYKKGEGSFKERQERYKKTKVEMDELIAKLRKEYPRYAALMYPKPFGVEELPLREDEILLEFEITDKASYLFVVDGSAGSPPCVKKLVKIPKSKKDIAYLVNEFIFPLQSQYTRESFSPSLGQQLYALLLEEALKDVFPDKEVIIVPDGILGLLPFEALVMKAGTDYKDSLYVGDKYKISYAQSATVLALNRILKPSQAPKSLFALGNPIYNKNDPRYIAYKQGQLQPVLLAQNKEQYSYRALATRREWGKTTNDDKEGKELIYTPLPETEDEVKTIIKLFDIQPEPPDVLLNVLANETNVRKSQLKNYRYIHFATHADLPGKVQGIKEPFLLLGQVENKGKDDGFLTLTEVLSLKLDAEMVVLSACLTGRGKMMEGEGVVNFARAFHHAGARSVLVSLWEVASKETVEYMKIFYGYLKAGRGRAEALRLARQEIKAKYPNPFYWAPFILHGESGAMTEQSSLSHRNSELSKRKPEPGLSFPWGKWVSIAAVFVLILLVSLYLKKRFGT